MTSQEMFEAQFDHQPKIDVRTPAMVEAGWTAAEAAELTR